MTTDFSVFFNITSKWNSGWGGTRHNHEFRHCRSNSLWKKPFCILSHLKMCRKVLYIYLDAILLSSTDPFDMFPDNHNLPFTMSGTSSINSGIMFVENTSESQKALEWWSNKGNGVCKLKRGWVDEQDCSARLSKKQFVSRLNDSSWNQDVQIFSKNKTK